MKKYGHIISQLRKMNGLTQEQLGKKLNVSYQAVSKWENNLSEPDLETIEKLTEIFGISISDFFDMSKNQEGIDIRRIHRKNNIKAKPWYIVAGLSVLIVILSLIAFLTPIKYSSGQIFQRVDASVFCITAESESTKQAGSGFFINNSGLAVTNYHVIKNCTSGQIQLNDGKTYDIKYVVGCDEKEDIAIIQIDIQKSKAVKLGDSNKIKVGDIVYAIGYPESFQLGSVDSTFTQGIISKTSYTYQGNTYIQTTVDMTRGNSGGVLINQQGQVIGITTLMLTDGIVDYMNMSIPINKINNVKRDINKSLSDYKDMHKKFYFCGDGGIYASKDFVIGNKVTPIETPTKTGYSFGGWYTTPQFETLFDFDSPVTDQTSCYAKWTPNSYTIRFNANGGEGTMTDVVATYDEELTLPNNSFQLLHYKFSGWKCKDDNVQFTNNEVVKNLTSENNKTIELNALWEKIKYTIVFNGNNASSGEMDNLILEYDQTANLPENKFTKTGYLFNGWTFNGKTYQNSQEVSNLCETEDTIEFLANWKPITYTVKFVYEEQSYEQEFTYDKVANLLPNRYSKENYYFSGWSCADFGNQIFTDNQEISNLTNVDKKVLEFRANFDENYYYIRFNYENSTGETETRLQKVSYSQEYSLSNYTPIKDGYILSHWVDENEKIYNLNDKVSHLLSGVGNYFDLYARWAEITYTVIYKISYNSNMTKTQYLGEKSYQEEFTLSECPFDLDGYNFEYYSVNNEKYNPNDTVSKLASRNNTTVYIIAVVTSKTYSIIFDGNGASSGTMETQYANYERDFELPTQSFTKENYTFVCWDYNGTTITDGQTINKLTEKYEESITLTAIWNDAMAGKGTEESPYIIEDLTDYRQLALSCRESVFGSPRKYYKLANDLDFEGVIFEPINYYKGVLDGDGHILKNIQFTYSTKIGLIGYSEGVTIKNLGIENIKCDIEGTGNDTVYVGALVANPEMCTIENCYVSGNFKIKNVNAVMFGGLVGQASGTINVTSSYSVISVTVENSKKSFVGGLVGHQLFVGNYKECYSIFNAKATVSTNVKIAGIVASIVSSSDTSITNCFVNVNIDFTPTKTSSNDTFFVGDIVCANGNNRVLNNYTSSLSKITHNLSDEQITQYLNGTTQEDSNLKQETFVKENVFSETANAWNFSDSDYPKLSIFSREV